MKTPPWGRAMPARGLAALALALGACGGDATSGSRPHGIVLVLYDTVRADHLSLHGYERDTSPALEALAARGVVFEQASSAAPWTIPSVATLWTGLYPAQHGAGMDEAVRKEMDMSQFRVFDDSLETLPGRMKALGYRTFAFIANPVVGVKAFTRDFDVYAVERLPAASLVSWVEERAEKLAEEPFFLYLHFMDAHAPLDPPIEHARRFLPPGFTEESLANLPRRWKYKETEETTSPGFRAYVAFRSGIYDAALAGLDEQLGRLCGILERQGLLESTLIAVTADHGEEMWDHWETQRASYDLDERPQVGYAHGHTLFQELLHVPLVLGGPGVARGKRVSARVTTLHLGATLLELAGGSGELGAGQSLAPWFAPDGAAPPRAQELFAESLMNGPELKSLVDGSGLKLIRSLHPGERNLLYDLEADPGERIDLWSSRPADAERLERRLDELRGSLDARRFPTHVPEERVAREELEALGYAGDS